MQSITIPTMIILKTAFRKVAEAARFLSMFVRAVLRDDICDSDVASLELFEFALLIEELVLLID